MKYKAVICDVDGTLIPNRSDAVLSERTKNVIAQASKKVHIGLATTRPIFLLPNVVQELKLSGPSVISGGAEIIDLSTHKVLSEHLILSDDLTFLTQTLTEEKLEIRIDDGLHDMQYDQKKTYKHIIKAFTTALDEKDADALIEKFKDRSQLAKFKVPSWVQGKFDVFFTHSLATKQHGILEVARLLGISTDEIIGIGDGHNDFPLLMACGLKVAMGNAVEDLKAIADYVAPTADEDGVADVIEKYILNN